MEEIEELDNILQRIKVICFSHSRRRLINWDDFTRAIKYNCLLWINEKS